MQGHCVSGTIHPGDQGSQKIRTGTHRFRTSRLPQYFLVCLETRLRESFGDNFKVTQIGKQVFTLCSML